MSAASEDGQERPHEATQRRIEQARGKGDVALSQDAQTAAAYLGLTAALAMGAGPIALAVGETLYPLLETPEGLARLVFSGGGAEIGGELGSRLVLSLLPLVLAPATLVVALLVAGRSVVVASSRVAPKLSRISPLQNAKNKFGPGGLVEFLKSFGKLAAVCGVLAWALLDEADRLAGYVRIEARLVGKLLEEQLWIILPGVLAVALAIGVADFTWQHFRHRRGLRMTHEEVKEETRDAEGDPYLRASRRQRGRELATNRMLLDVPKADVVITNPTHYAVALAWDRAQGSAPRCIAKGVDEIAAAIRSRADEAGIPIRPDPPTARALHAVVAIGAEIQPEHYRAVAAAIVFADQMRKKSPRASPRHETPQGAERSPRR